MNQAKETTEVIDYKSLGYRKVLLVEDVEFNQYIARQMLEAWGFDVRIANNGVEALDLLQKNEFDCILMDIQMPEMDGLQAATLIRKLPDPVKAAIPIIAVTANALKGDAEKYIAAGMSDFLAKPLVQAKLFRIISKNLTHKTGVYYTTMEARNSHNLKDNSMIQETSDTLYDLAMVKSVSGGDESFIKKMVNLFIETVPPNVAELKKAMLAADWEQVAKLAHKLKSTVDSMGIKSLKTDIRSVEANAKQQSALEEIPALVDKIESVINACVEQLRIDILQ